METKPILSIVIPAFNNKKYMDACLESVLQQSYNDYEIILYDDCSTDGTYDILTKYESKHSNIKLFRNKRNLGVIQTRHAGILKATGKYVTTLDHDDIYLSEDKLKKEMELVLYYKKNFGKDICAFSKTMIIDSKSKIICPEINADKIAQGNIFNDIITRSCMIPRDFIFLRDDYNKIGGFDQKLKLFEDWDLKIRLSKFREFYYTKNVGTGYRRSGEGFSYQFKEQEILRLMKVVFKKNINLVENNSITQLIELFRQFLRDRKKQVKEKLWKKYRRSLEEKNYRVTIATLLEIFKINYSNIEKL